MDFTVRNSIYTVCTMVINKTPVDTGRLRANWQSGVNYIPGGTVAEDADYAGELNDAVMEMKLGDMFYFYNNLDYAPVVEYGLYPNPVKKGSYVKGKKGEKGTWVKKSENGYSKQAPQGMLRISIQQWTSVVNQSWYEAAANNGFFNYPTKQ